MFILPLPHPLRPHEAQWGPLCHFTVNDSVAWCLSFLSPHPLRPNEAQWRLLCHSTVNDTVTWCLSILSPHPLRPSEDLCAVSPYSQGFSVLVSIHPLPHPLRPHEVQWGHLLHSTVKDSVACCRSILSPYPIIPLDTRWGPLSISKDLVAWCLSILSPHPTRPLEAKWGPLCHSTV